MCAFCKVSRSGYYKWLKRSHDDNDKELGKLIKLCQHKTRQTYGYRRVKLWLAREYGMMVNHKKLLRLMNKYGLCAQIRRPKFYRRYQTQLEPYTNRLNRNFKADKPNMKWVTDITYIHTKQGVLYLSAIKDLYDNFIVAYEMGDSQDVQLVLRTIKQAKKEVASGLTLHSDQGFQYTSKGYSRLTRQYAILPSMSRAGTPLDNAPAENFFGILKTECVKRQKIQTFAEAKQLIDDYIYFYNYERIQLKTKQTPYEKRCLPS